MKMFSVPTLFFTHFYHFLCFNFFPHPHTFNSSHPLESHKEYARLCLTLTDYLPHLFKVSMFFFSDKNVFVLMHICIMYY